MQNSNEMLRCSTDQALPFFPIQHPQESRGEVMRLAALEFAYDTELNSLLLANIQIP